LGRVLADLSKLNLPKVGLVKFHSLFRYDLIVGLLRLHTPNISRQRALTIWHQSDLRSAFHQVSDRYSTWDVFTFGRPHYPCKSQREVVSTEAGRVDLARSKHIPSEIARIAVQHRLQKSKLCLSRRRHNSSNHWSSFSFQIWTIVDTSAF
jgi:hypothetical protein